MDYTCQEEVVLDMRTLQERQRDIERQWNEILKEKREVEARMHTLEQREKQFDIKWNMLIEETQKLADDKKTFERKKTFFDRVNAQEERSYSSYSYSTGSACGDMFFSGVTNEIALKKRYKELIKIYHPDAESGDTETIQEINRQYESLRQQMGCQMSAAQM